MQAFNDSRGFLFYSVPNYLSHNLKNYLIVVSASRTINRVTELHGSTSGKQESTVADFGINQTRSISNIEGAVRTRLRNKEELRKMTQEEVENIVSQTNTNSNEITDNNQTTDLNCTKIIENTKESVERLMLYAVKTP